MTGPLAAELTVRTAAAAKDALTGWLDAGGAGAERTLDCSEVEEIDTAGLQLLVAVAAEVAARGGRLRLEPVSPAVGDVLALARLDAGLARVGG